MRGVLIAGLLICSWTISFAAQAQEKQAAAPRDPVLVTISEKTTRITEPLKESGYPDFLEAMNNASRGKVTPQTNGAVLVVRALSPEDLTPEQKIEFYQRLGIEPITPGKPQLIDAETFIDFLPNKKLPKPTREENKIKDKAERFGKIRERLHTTLDECTRQPWTDQEYPLIAQWLDDQAAVLKHLDQLREYPLAYFPVVRDTKNSSLLHAKMPLYKPLRSVASALAIRGQRAVAVGRFDDAIDDFERILIMWAHLRQHSSLSTGFANVSIGNNELHDLFNSIVASLKLTTQQIQQVQELLAKHDRYQPTYADAIDKYERWAFLDAICRYAEFGMHGSDNDAPEKLEYRKLYDYDSMLFRANQEFDRQRDLWSIRDSIPRLTAVNELDREQHTRDPILVFPLTKYVAFLTKEGRSKHHIEVMLVLAAPSASMVSRIGERRDCTRRVMWHTTLQMLAFRQKHGRFPEKLTELLPDASSNPPPDCAVWQQGLTYQGGVDSFLLYSWDFDSIDQHGYRGNALNGDHCDDLAIFTADRRPKQPKTDNWSRMN